MNAFYIFRCFCMQCGLFTWWNPIGKRTEHRRCKGVWLYVWSSPLYSQRSSNNFRGKPMLYQQQENICETIAFMYMYFCRFPHQQPH